MTTDTTERGFERLICTSLTGHPCDPPKVGEVLDPQAAYGGSGWICGNPSDYNREYCVDLVQLKYFLKHYIYSKELLVKPGWSLN